MLLIKNITGTVGTNAENAIYGLTYANGIGTVSYSDSSRDFRDENVKVSQHDYSMVDVNFYIRRGDWGIGTNF